MQPLSLQIFCVSFDWLFLVNMDPNLPKFVVLGLIIIGLGALLRFLKQPYVVAYILAGVLLGEHGFAIITDREVIMAMGEFGLILLLFFIGMEISLPKLVRNWKVPLIGTSLQVLGSVLMVAAIGWWLGWDMARIVTMGFIISLSSSAVVIKLLQDNGEADLPIGQDVISILLMQDIFIVPMLIATSYLGGQPPTANEIILQLAGGVLIIGALIYIFKKQHIHLPFGEVVEQDHELQVFVAFSICFGFAVVTALFGLSAALGAFVGGLFIHAAHSTAWLHDSLHSFRVIFVALFFVSVGTMIDLGFLVTYWKTVAMIIVAVYLSNHFINGVILHIFGENWKMSLYGGALLAQVGELGFVLSASAFHAGIIGDFSYQLTIIVISLTLLVSPFWIAGTKRVVGLKTSR